MISKIRFDDEKHHSVATHNTASSRISNVVAAPKWRRRKATKPACVDSFMATRSWATGIRQQILTLRVYAFQIGAPCLC